MDMYAYTELWTLMAVVEVVGNIIYTVYVVLVLGHFITSLRLCTFLCMLHTSTLYTRCLSVNLTANNVKSTLLLDPEIVSISIYYHIQLVIVYVC